MPNYVSETAVSLHIHGDDLDPDEVTLLMGHPPSDGRRKGQIWYRPNGKPSKAWTGSWMRDSERRIPGDLDAQIEEILSPLTTDLSIWRDLSERFTIRLFIGIFVREWNQVMELKPATMKAAGERGILLDFDVYAEVPEGAGTSDEDTEA